jgi:hypothetical protein
MRKYITEYIKNLILLNLGKSITLIVSIILGVILLSTHSPSEIPIEYKIVSKFTYNDEVNYIIIKNDGLQIDSGGEEKNGKLVKMIYPIWYSFLIFFCVVLSCISVGVVVFSLHDLNSSWETRDVSYKSKMGLIRCSEEIEGGKTNFCYTFLGRLVYRSPVLLDSTSIMFLCRDEINIRNINIYPEYLSKSEKRLKKLNKILG